MSTARDGVEDLRVVPVRHPGRWAAVAVIAVLAAMLAHNLLTSPRWKWSLIGDNLTTRHTLIGMAHTIELTAIAMVIGVVGGILLAVMRLSPNPVVASASWLYIWFFRGTPVYVQILFWYAAAALFPRISFGIPFGPEFVHFSANTLITTFTAAILALGLNEAAYMSEIVRAGILSVDEGQSEAAAALGMTRGLTMRRIVLPQAMRVIIPPTGNETISMLKTTSLVSAISYSELLQSVKDVYVVNFQVIPLLLVASIWYLVMTSVLTVGQFYVERYFARGSSAAAPPPTLPERLWRALRHVRPHSEPQVPGASAEGR
jgi:polar amino acid transport system permease protein